TRRPRPNCTRPPESRMTGCWTSPAGGGSSSATRPRSSRAGPPTTPTTPTARPMPSPCSRPRTARCGSPTFCRDCAPGWREPVTVPRGAHMATPQKPPPSLDRKPAAPARPPEAAALLADVRNHARREFARALEQLDPSERWRALALAVRDRMMDRLVDTSERYAAAGAKRVAYLSMEFLVGRSLANNLHNMGLFDDARELFAGFGIELADVLEFEPDAALGNGGLGRLAACFLDSLATLHLPGYGYGINYEYGLFRQDVYNGAQRERPENWLTFGTPWQICRPSECVPVPVYGRIEHAKDRAGNYNPM